LYVNVAFTSILPSFNCVSNNLPAKLQNLVSVVSKTLVSSTAVKAYKAIVIIIIVVAGSPVVKAWLGQVKNRIAEKIAAKKALAAGEAK